MDCPQEIQKLLDIRALLIVKRSKPITIDIPTLFHLLLYRVYIVCWLMLFDRARGFTTVNAY